MKKTILAVAGLFVAGLCFAAWGAPVLRVMPLGDSITQGSKSEDTAGYRGPLWTKLLAAGYNVDYVGSNTATPGTVAGMDINHEGHGGWKIDDRYGSNGKGIYEMLPTWCGMFEAPARTTPAPTRSPTCGARRSSSTASTSSSLPPT